MSTKSNLFSMKFIDQEKYSKLIGVYKITNLVDRQFYLGSVSHGTSGRSFKTRYKEHKRDLELGLHNPKFQNAFNLYGPENFTFEILEICEKDEDCVPREQFYLDTLLFAQEYIRRENYKFYKLGYNHNPIAANSLGHRHSESSKEQMRISKIKLYRDFPEKREAARQKNLDRYQKDPEIPKRQGKKLEKYYKDHPEARENNRQKSLKYLEDHPEKREHNIQMALNRPIFTCDCGKKIKGKGNFDRHVNYCKNKLSPEEKSKKKIKDRQTRELNKEVLYCKYNCGKTTKNIGGIKVHETYCVKNLNPTKEQLKLREEQKQRHIQTQLNNPTFICSCGKEIRGVGPFKTHQKFCQIYL